MRRIQYNKQGTAISVFHFVKFKLMQWKEKQHALLH